MAARTAAMRAVAAPSSARIVATGLDAVERRDLDRVKAAACRLAGPGREAGGAAIDDTAIDVGVERNLAAQGGAERVRQGLPARLRQDIPDRLVDGADRRRFRPIAAAGADDLHHIDRQGEFASDQGRREAGDVIVHGDGSAMERRLAPTMAAIRTVDTDEIPYRLVGNPGRQRRDVADPGHPRRP